MKPEVSPTPRGESTSLSDEVIQVHMMRELFTRTRESALLGFAPVFLLAWAHWDAQPVRRLAYWRKSVV